MYAVESIKIIGGSIFAMIVGDDGFINEMTFENTDAPHAYVAALNTYAARCAA